MRSVTTFNKGSAPHNVLTGTNFAAPLNCWTSESKRVFTYKNYKDSFNTKAVGLRMEELQFVG